MNETWNVTEDDLHAYVDGRLETEERLRVEAWLAEHPDDAATVHAYLLQNTRLHDRYDTVLAEEVPAATTKIVTARAGGAARSRGAPSWLRLAASIALVVAGAAAGTAGGWWLHGAQRGGDTATAFADMAIGAHEVFAAEVRHPVEVPATQEAHLVAWLSKRLDTKLKAPDLRQAGLTLVGGRLLADGPKPAAQLMYQTADGRRATVYIRAATGSRETSFQFASDGGLSAFYWVDENYAYALVAPMARAELLKVAEKCYRDMEAQ